MNGETLWRELNDKSPQHTGIIPTLEVHKTPQRRLLIHCNYKKKNVQKPYNNLPTQEIKIPYRNETL